MNQTPINVDFNGDLLAIVPPDAMHVVEVGCSGGGMAHFCTLGPAWGSYVQ